jgi:hypothetical protein
MTKRAISKEGFQKLNTEEQLNLLYKDGVHIGKTTIQNHTAILYQLNDFYVEVIYKSYRKDVGTINLFSDVNSIQSYLDQVPVRDLDKDENKND